MSPSELLPVAARADSLKAETTSGSEAKVLPEAFPRQHLDVTDRPSLQTSPGIATTKGGKTQQRGRWIITVYAMGYEPVPMDTDSYVKSSSRQLLLTHQRNHHSQPTHNPSPFPHLKRHHLDPLSQANIVAQGTETSMARTESGGDEFSPRILQTLHLHTPLGKLGGLYIKYHYRYCVPCIHPP